MYRVNTVAGARCTFFGGIELIWGRAHERVLRGYWVFDTLLVAGAPVLPDIVGPGYTVS